MLCFLLACLLALFSDIWPHLILCMIKPECGNEWTSGYEPARCLDTWLLLLSDYCYLCVSYSTTVTCDCTRVLQTPLHNHRNCENCGVDVCEETGVCIVYMSSRVCQSVFLRSVFWKFIITYYAVSFCSGPPWIQSDSLHWHGHNWPFKSQSAVSIQVCLNYTIFVVALMPWVLPAALFLSFLPSRKGWDKAIW